MCAKVITRFVVGMYDVKSSLRTLKKLGLVGCAMGVKKVLFASGEKEVKTGDGKSLDARFCAKIRLERRYS